MRAYTAKEKAKITAGAVAERLEAAERAPTGRQDLRSGEHLGLALGDVIVKPLEAEPSDERAADVLAAVGDRANVLKTHELLSVSGRRK